MKRSIESMGFLVSGLLAACLLGGCSDDKGGSGSDKPKPSAAAEPTPTKPKATSAEPTSSQPRPGEGKVEVKAEPEPAPAEEPMPHSTGKPTSVQESGENQTPKFSSFASAADLDGELKILIADLERAVDNRQEYESQVEGRFARDGNTITLIAIALGLHDQDNPAKPYAKAIAAAAEKLAKTNDYDATVQAVADLKAAIGGKGAASGKSDGADLKWTKVAKLDNLMKAQMTGINTRLKTGLRHFKDRTSAVAANAATMALIGESAKLYLADTKLPSESKKWNDFADQFQSAAVDLAAAAHAGDEAGAKVAADKLNASCESCHAVFNPAK